MVSFESDYIAGAHPDVLRRLAETNLEPLAGYGSDPYCSSPAMRCWNFRSGTEKSIRKICAHISPRISRMRTMNI